MKHIIRSNGTEYWFDEKESFASLSYCNRLDGPCIIEPNGSEFWSYKKGNLHRQNNYSVIYVDGNERLHKKSNH